MQKANSFLCFFYVRTGAKLIAWVHLMTCIYTVAAAIGDVIVGSPHKYAVNVGTQVFTAAWSLAGIPLVSVGLWGIYYSLETHVRIYFYYLAASLAFDTYSVGKMFLRKDVCVHLKGAALLNGGQAFACGVARTMSFSVLVVSTVVVAYLTYIVWSFVQDLNSDGIADVIGELLGSMEAREERLENPYYQSVQAQNADYEAIERSMLRASPPSGNKLTRLAQYMA
eukprot:TRINITY_DN63429_c0_g1_i1.p1 TRINITY_DN63429_c0_g1~~TRINITY_DN63429_c0_g1_i1.p1  ORF type:complete len:225 (+),score=38.34 TRINITY_DN63429_c0_g1_i1:120-794(+)